VIQNIYSPTNNGNPSPNHSKKIHTINAYKQTCIKTQKIYKNYLCVMELQIIKIDLKTHKLDDLKF
jgi:hypothetical protein